MPGASSQLFDAATNETINDSQQVIQANDATRIAWLVLNIWPSHLGLPLLIATILLSKNIRRHATFINLCITWIIIGLVSSILLYTGYQTGPEPPRILCLIQASLLYGQPGLTSMSAFALVFQVFYVIRAAFHEKDPQYHGKLRKWTLLIAPYIAFFSFAAWSAYVGFKDPSLVSRERRFFYCSVKNSTLTNSITIFSSFVLLVTIGLELWISYTTYKHWQVMRANDLGERTGMDLNLILRTAAFAVWIFLGICLSALSIKAPQSPVPDMALATMGSAVVLVFGTQRDVLRAWMFWNRSQGDRRVVNDKKPSRTDSLSSGYSSKRSESHFSAWSLQPSIEASPIRQERDILAAQYGRKPKGPVSIRDISQPVLREDLTFPVHGRAV